MVFWKSVFGLALAASIAACSGSQAVGYIERNDAPTGVAATPDASVVPTDGASAVPDPVVDASGQVQPARDAGTDSALAVVDAGVDAKVAVDSGSADASTDAALDAGVDSGPVACVDGTIRCAGYEARLCTSTGDWVHVPFTDSSSRKCCTNPRYAPTQDGTVYDTVTHLTWHQGGGSSANQAAAIMLCDTFDFAGHTDWRLPTYAELQTIVIGNAPAGQEQSCWPTADHVAFPLCSYQPAYATVEPTRGISFDQGTEWHFAATDARAVRCVHD